MIYSTTAFKPPKYTYYQKEQQYFADVVPSRINFAMASYKPEKQYKRIDIGAGVDIDELLDILESTGDF